MGALLPQALPARALPFDAVAVYAVRVVAGFVGEDGEVGWGAVFWVGAAEEGGGEG